MVSTKIIKQNNIVFNISNNNNNNNKCFLSKSAY